MCVHLKLAAVSWIFDQGLPAAWGLFQLNFPVLFVAGLSVVIGLLTTLVFRYASDQKAIHIVKDQLKAHMLAVRLYRDQLPVVLSSYGRILRGTGLYLRLAFRPLLYLILPLTFLIVQVDRYLGSAPMQPGKPFLVTVHTATAEQGNETTLQVPPGLAITAPPVRIAVTHEVVWRLVAKKDGNYNVNVGVAGQRFGKRVVVSSGLARLSPARLRGRPWERIFVSTEPALPENSAVQSIEVNYPSRNLYFAGLEWNWMWLFLLLSLIAGFFFKTLLGIEI